MGNQEIRVYYQKLERNVLILIAVPLPFFAFAYLYTQSDTMDLTLPKVSEFLNSFGLGFAVSILVIHYFTFHNAIRAIITGDFHLERKIARYGEATMLRFWMLLLSSFICTLGLLFFENQVYTIVYAVTLVFLSLGKPTPDRIVRLLKLRGEDKEAVLDLKKRI